MNSRCITAFALAALIFSGFLLRASLRAMKVQKALHSGEPMTMYGFCDLTIFIALSCFLQSLKSHGRPSSGSTTVRSSANPGTRCLWPIFLSSAVTRGGEYISEMIFRPAFCASRL